MKLRCRGCKRVFLMREGLRAAEAVPEPEAPASPAPTPSSQAGDEISVSISSAFMEAVRGTAGGDAERRAGAAPAGQAWQVDRVDYEDSTFSMEQIQDMVKGGWVDGADRIRVKGDTEWMEAGDHPALATAFALHKKREAMKLSSGMLKQAGLGCANHAARNARYVCDPCHKAFCDRCVNETEIRDQKVMLCIECDEPMREIGSGAN